MRINRWWSKNQKGITIVEILVACTIFLVMFSAVATTYALGINLQYRSELSTSAELIGQFLLEYFTSNHPLAIVRGSFEYMGNLPYPASNDDDDESNDYSYLTAKFPNPDLPIYRKDLEFDDFDAMYNIALDNGTFVQDRYFRSEWAPHQQYFPYIFMIDEFKTLPPGTSIKDEEGKVNLNRIFPDSIRFEFVDNIDNTKDYYQITLNSFPPFFIAHSPELRYRLTIRESTFDPNNPNSTVIPLSHSRFYEVFVEVQWKVKGKTEPFKYELKALVPHFGN